MSQHIKRPLVLFSAGFAAGLLAICFIIPQHILFAAVFCIALTLLSIRLKGKRRRIMLVLIAGISASVLIWTVYGRFVYDPIVTAYENRTGIMTGVVYTNPEIEDGYCKADVKLYEINGEKEGFRVRVYLENCEDIEPGDVVTLYGTLKKPGERWYFSNLNYLKAKRVFLSCYSDEYYVNGNENIWWLIPIRTANMLSKRLSQLMPERNSALMLALMLGDDSGLDDEFINQLRITGLSHIIAVSGMNVAFLSSIILSIFGRKKGYIAAIPAISFFMLMAGMTASVVRAGIMQIIAMLSYKKEREYDSITAMSAAALIMFIVNPYSIADAGLWMSFAASLGLILAAGPLIAKATNGLKRKKNIASRAAFTITGTAITTLSAQLFVLPIQILLFGKISVVSPLANILCVWAAEFSFFVGFFASILSLVWFAGGKIIAFGATALTDYIFVVVPRLAALPYAEADAKNIYIISALILVYAILICAFLIFKRNRRLALLCAGIILFAGIFAVNIMDANSIKISIIDCASGQSIIVHDRSTCTVINCGGSSKNDSSAVSTYLADNRIERIDTLILTDSRKPSSGNAETLTEHADVKRLILPSAQDERKTQICGAFSLCGTEICRADSDGLIDCGTYTVNYYVNQENDRIAVYIDAGRERMLISGSMPNTELAEIVGRIDPQGGIYIAGGDYYADHALPGSVLSLCRECIVSSFGGADAEIKAWAEYYGTQYTECDTYAAVTLTVPLK